MARTLSNVTAIVTGASSGLGLATARSLAFLGANVIMACREPARAEKHATRIREAAGNFSVEVRRLDLADPASVRAFAKSVTIDNPEIQILVNNAGIFPGRRRRVTAAGVELSFATNHLGHFQLTNLLLPTLKASAPARIVHVVSDFHRSAYPNLDDVNFEKQWNARAAYGHSNLCKVAYAYALARRLEGTGVSSTCVWPGLVRTRWARYQSWWVRVLWGLASPFVPSARKSADTIVWASASPELDAVSGKYYHRREERTPSPLALETEFQDKLWNLSEGILEPKAPPAEPEPEPPAEPPQGAATPVVAASAAPAEAAAPAQNPTPTEPNPPA